MRPKENIEKFVRVRKPHVATSRQMDKRTLDDSFAAMGQTIRAKSADHKPSASRIITRSRTIKLAAAAVIILCAVLYLLVTLQKSAQDQPTIAVTKTVRPEVASSEGMVTAMVRIVLPPPGPNEVQLDKTLLGHKRNLRVPEDGWIQIGKGIFWQYTVGKYLNFTQEDVRVYVTVDEEPRQLAGLLLSDPSEIVLLNNALKELSEPTILWCKCPLPPEFITLPNLEKIIYLQRVASIGGTYNEGMNTFLNKRASVLVKFSDLSPLSNLTGLTSLDLRGCNQITDLSPLSNLTNLSSLNLAGCDKISDIYPLAHLTNLTWLDLSAWDLDSPFSDLSPLSALTQLRSLDLRLRQNVSDLTPLAELAELESLDLMGCSRDISDLSPLTNLTKLKTLKLSSLWNVVDLSQLGKLTSLEFLVVDAVNNSVIDTFSLTNLKALRHLELSQWQYVTDISSLAGLTNLISLKLRTFRRLSDISPLAELKNLQSLEFNTCENISDLSPLAQLTNLRNLTIKGRTGVSDIWPLKPLIAQGMNLYVSDSLEEQLSAINIQILSERIAESSAIVQAKILETTDTEVDQKLIRSDWKVEIISNLYGEVPGKIINVVIHEPDPKISENSFGREMILFLRDENETGSYALIHAQMRSTEHDEEILQVIERGTDLSVDPPN